jgi:hypothetical protein
MSILELFITFYDNFTHRSTSQALGHFFKLIKVKLLFLKDLFVYSFMADQGFRSPEEADRVFLILHTVLNSKLSTVNS